MSEIPQAHQQLPRKKPGYIEADFGGVNLGKCKKILIKMNDSWIFHFSYILGNSIDSKTQIFNEVG